MEKISNSHKVENPLKQNEKIITRTIKLDVQKKKCGENT